MRYKDRTIRSIAELLRALKRQSGVDQIVWFRGQARKDWKLVPSLARKKKNLLAENALIKRFMQNAVPHVNRLPHEEWEWMFLMQHHRAFTRLLDWTESPLAALYFAVSATRHSRVDGAVWCLDPIALNREANLKFSFDSEIPAFGHDKVLESYLPSRVQQNPTELNPVGIVGPRNTARMAAQMGVFTVNHRLHTPLEAIGECRHIWRWVVPGGEKANILEELAHLGISTLTLFPELDSVAELTRKMLP